jgi:hypothetical protein
MKIKMQRFGKPYEPGKERRKKRNALLGVLIFLLIAIVIVTLISIRIETIIRHSLFLGRKKLGRHQLLHIGVVSSAV